jgi:hypothetical protein
VGEIDLNGLWPAKAPCGREKCWVREPTPDLCHKCLVLFPVEDDMGSRTVSPPIVVEKVSIEDGGRVKVEKVAAPDYGYRDTPVAAELKRMEEVLKEEVCKATLYEQQWKDAKKSLRTAWQVAIAACLGMIALTVLVCMLIAAGYGGGQ